MPDSVSDVLDTREDDIVPVLREIAGGPQVLTALEDRVFFSTDIASQGATAAAVVKVGDTETLSKLVAACSAAGYITIPRGGGFSYTGGYTPGDARTVVIDLRPMDKIVEINTQDMYVVVEVGCTWKRLYEALKEKGVRTPYFGPMSGYRASVGGALSQGSLFLGSTQYGLVSDSVLGLEVVLADGSVLRTGSGGSNHGASPFLRQYGPDVTGMFLSDTGAMGFKTRAVLKLIPFPSHQAYGSFAFTDYRSALAALSDIGRSGLTAECYCWDPFFVKQVMAENSSVESDFRYLINVIKAGSGWLDGLLAGARMALAGKRIFDGKHYLLHVVIDDASGVGAAAKLKQVRALARKAGGREVAPSAPRTLRGTPFTDFNTPALKSTSRNLPTNSLSPHSRAGAVADELYAMLDRRAAEMQRLGLECGIIFFAVGTQAVTIEPLVYWDDAEHAMHDRIAEKSDVAGLARFTERPEATRVSMEMRDEFKAIFRKHGCAHVQVGRSYPWAATRDPVLLKLVRGFKVQVDPGNLVNRGCLALDV